MIAYHPGLTRNWTWKILVSGFLACGLPKPQLLLQPQLALRSAVSSSFLVAGANRAVSKTMTSLCSTPVGGEPPSNSSEGGGRGSSRSLRRIAVGQLRSTSDKWSNLASVAVCAGRAKKQGARMLFLPENAGFLGSSARETVDQADPPTAQADPDAIRNDELVTRALREIVSKHALLPENDDLSGSGSSSSSSAVIPSCPVAGNEIVILDGLRTIAKESEMWLAGTIHVGGAPPSSAEKSQPSSTSSEDNNPASRVYNTHVVVDDQGRLAAEYNKIHLFDVEIPGQVAHRESASTAPGRAAVVCDSPVGRLGLSTCYDVRFPELYAELVRRGAQVLLVPSAFTVPTGRAHWHVLLRARAIETQCYVVAAAQSGRHNSKRKSYGHSLVVDPWGTVVVDADGIDTDDGANRDDKEKEGAVGRGDLVVDPIVVCCDLDLDLVDTIRQRMPVQRHREQSVWK